MEILAFFLVHYFSSLFFQTFFLHRYGAHKMFTMSNFWEKFFFIATYITQGSSFLNPRAYAIMHRMHHAFSDTERDPHSPHYFRSVFNLMVHTKKVYRDLIENKIKEGEQFAKRVPSWPAFENFADRWIPRIMWGALYTLFYVQFATSWWMYLLLPIHFFMGPIHGAIVNWCGHKYGYVNYPATNDNSKNTLFFDFLTMGELFQNNHHRFPNKLKFSVKFFEFDPAYPIIKLLGLLNIIKITGNKG